MRYFFLIISFWYSFIFYLFYIISQKKDIYFNGIENSLNIINLSLKDSLILSSQDNLIIQSFFWNLIFEVIIFFIIWIVLFFSFSSYEEKEKKQIPETNNFFSKQLTFSNTIKILKKFSYYIWFILFYISIYLMSLSLEFISFWWYIFIISILIYSYFLISKFSLISKDFLRINSILFSILYIISYFYIILTWNNFFGLIDFVNSFLIILIFPTLLYFEKKINNKNSFDNLIIVHFSLYIFSVYLFYTYHYIFSQNLIFWITILSTLFWIIWFEFLPKFNFLKNNKIVLKYIWILFSYIWILFWIIYLFLHFSIIIFSILLLQWFYNLFIHKKYINYISYTFSVFLFLFLFYYLIIYFEIINFKTIYFMILSLVISYLFIFLSYFQKFKTKLDHYIIHIFSYLINIISIALFFIFNNFEILNIWILLLTESIYFFLSYNKLNSKKS